MGRRSPLWQKQRLQTLLRDLRVEAQLSQAELARILNRPQSFVAKYEAGERRLDILEMNEICQALGISFLTFARRLERSLKR